jgi:tetratricopeptide (TPR) repeat protein
MRRAALVLLPFLLPLAVPAQVAVGHRRVPSSLRAAAYNQGLDEIREGRYAEALLTFRSGLKIRWHDNSSILEGQDLRAGVVYVLTLQGQYDLAQEPIRMETQYRKTMPRYIPPACHLMFEEGLLEEASGHVKQARETVSDCLYRFKDAEIPVPSARYALDLLAQFDMDLGSMGAAETALRRAEAAWEKDPPVTDLSRILRARLYRTDARFRRLKGDLAGAETAARTALEMHEKDLAAKNYDVILDQLELAEVLRSRGVLVQAEAMYQASFKALVTALGPGQPLAKQVLQRYAELLRGQDRAKDLAQVEATLARLPVIPCESCSPRVHFKPTS